jgi:hypothetical protein
LARRSSMADKKRRIHIWLNESDVDRIHAIFDGKLGFSDACRHMIRKVLDQIEAKAAEAAQTVELEDEV